MKSRERLLCALLAVGSMTCTLTRESLQTLQRQQGSDSQSSTQKTSLTSQLRNKPHLVFTDVQARHERPGDLVPPSDLRPERSSNPTPSQSSCQLHYQLIHPPDLEESAARRLEALENAPMYGCTRDSYDAANHIAAFSCRYVSAITLPSPPKDARFTPWTGMLVPRKPFKVWYETTVPVDSSGIPIDEASQFVQPIGARIDGQLYLYAQEVISLNLCSGEMGTGGSALGGSDTGGSSAYDKPSSFDYSNCQNRKACHEAILLTFYEQAKRAFGAPPLMAEHTMDSAARRNELWFRRERRQSLVLGGNKFELANYIVDWEGVPDEPEEEPRELSIRVRESILVASHRQSIYREPQPDERYRYDVEVARALERAVSNTCDKHNGSTARDICYIKEVSP